MSAPSASGVGLRQYRCHRQPNAGKSTLFNRLTGLRQSTGNFPGVTVEKHAGMAQIGDSALELVDCRAFIAWAGFGR